VSLNKLQQKSTNTFNLLKSYVKLNFKMSFPPHRKHCVPNTKQLFNDVYSETHMKPINTKYGLNVHFFKHKLKYAVYIVTIKPICTVSYIPPNRSRLLNMNPEPNTWNTSQYQNVAYYTNELHGAQFPLRKQYSFSWWSSWRKGSVHHSERLVTGIPLSQFVWENMRAETRLKYSRLSLGRTFHYS
jgi:hypothetical protein